MPKKKKIEKQKELDDFFRDEENEIKAMEIQQKSIERKQNKKNTQEDEEQKQENIEKMLQTISTNKKIPKDIMKKIYSAIFENLFIAIVIMVYMIFIILGYRNIEKGMYATDIKVFTGILFVLTIYLMEKSYKNKNIKLIINSIECLALSICNMFFIYFHMMFFEQYCVIVGIVSLSFAVYYMIKSIIVLFIKRRKYLRTMSDIIEILSSDYDKEDFKCQEV